MKVSGKSTLALLILGFLSPTKGEVKLNDDNIQKLNRSQKREFLRIIQPVYQDPFASFNPFYKINRVLEYPLIKYKLASTKSKIYDEIKNVLDKVGLKHNETLDKYPHQLSGGQRQRLMIARAYWQTKIYPADEPVSMVDASLRSSILSELKNLSKKIIFIYYT